MLKTRAIELRLRNVTFTGKVPPSEIARHYRDADIYVQTPSIDNMPGSVVEAFASGLPVVATNVGGVPAILTDGVHGLLAADDDDAGIAAGVIEVLEQQEDARRRAAAARETCEAYRWPVVRDAWIAAYRSVMPRHPRTRPVRAAAA